MSNPRSIHILASTALALVLAIPFMSIAIETNNLAAVAIAGTPPETAPAQAALVAAAPRTDIPAAASAASAPETATATEQVIPTATEQTAERDPLAALNPADRALAEKIRDLLATKADRFFASKRERTGQSSSIRIAISPRSGSKMASRMPVPKQ